MKRLLLIEDEEVILRALTRLLERHRYEVVAARDVDGACEHDPREFDLVLADIRLPGRDGTAIIPLADPVPVVIMTSHASLRSAVEAMRAGASDYIAKPFDHDELLLVLERAHGRNLVGVRNRALERDLARAEPAAERIRDTSLDALVDALAHDAAADAALHLYGERGAGREDVARERHARGPHATNALFVVEADGTASADDARELLGKEGSGGGLLRAARAATVVLRHPERLTPLEQEALAARLAPVEPGGRAREREAGDGAARLVTIASRPLRELGAGGGLVTALAERLDGALEAEVPPLRRRREDIAALARRAASRLGRRHAARPFALDEGAVAALVAREWPGNVAELETAIARAVLDADERAAPTLGERAFAAVPDASRPLDLDAYFRYAVLRHQETLSETELAERLGISRKALWERRQKMDLVRPANARRSR